MQSKKKIEQTGITALYCRLSRDNGGDGDSNSIVNQRKMLTKYAKENGFSNTRFYVDDGITGTRFDRPGFQAMLDDIDMGYVSTVIVKDLSRLGRDYVSVGQYTDIYFPDANPEEKWMIFKDVHEPIIDRETFEQVQKLIGKTRRRNSKPENWERNMFCDLLYCADCGRKLWFNIKHDKEDIPFFMCGNYHGNRGTCSSTHYLRADAIDQVVTLELRRLSKCLCDDEESFATLLADKTNADILKEKKHIENEMQKCIVRSEQGAELCIKCYEDNVSGKLTDEMYMRFSQKYETERLELKEKIAAYRRRLAEANEMQLGKEKFIAAVRKFMQMDRLTAPLLQELIDRIDVYEVTGTGKNRKQQIKIHYKFVGYLELPSLASQNNYREETRKGVAVEYVPNALPA